MIAVDSNILIYAHREDSPFHERAASRLTELAEGPANWAIAWPCLHEFLAIVTHPRVYAPPTPLKSALEQIESWLESPSLTLLSETEGYWTTLRSLLLSSHVAAAQVHDARVAAICIHHGVRELWSADRDFSRFVPLVVVNPLLPN